MISAGESERHCSNIDYFPHEDYSPDPNDSTMSIPCKSYESTAWSHHFFSTVWLVLMSIFPVR